MQRNDNCSSAITSSPFITHCDDCDDCDKGGYGTIDVLPLHLSYDVVFVYVLV